MRAAVIYFKKYGIWMLLSYALMGILFLWLVLAPQRREIAKMKVERNRVEYDWSRMKNSSNFFQRIASTIEQASLTVERFHWLDAGYDPNLVFFDYVSSLAERSGLQFVEMVQAAATDEKEKARYLFWRVGCQGTFGNVVRFLREVENGPKYLRIEQIQMKPDEKGRTYFDLTLSGLKPPNRKHAR